MLLQMDEVQAAGWRVLRIRTRYVRVRDEDFVVDICSVAVCTRTV